MGRAAAARGVGAGARVQRRRRRRGRGSRLGGVEAAHSFDLRFEGKIIGRAGSKINELQQTHGVRLQVEKGAGRLLMLGAPDAIARCVADVEALCRDDQTEGWIVETVQVGERNEGRVIGAGGCVIRDLEARTGCSVRVQKGEGTCTIGGTDQQEVAAAKAEVYKVCEAAGTPVNGFAANADNVVERVSVYRRGGLVVGPQGVNIRRIKDESGAHVQVMRETEEAVVTGSREKVAAAVAMIGEILATMPYRPHEMHGAPPEAQARYAAQAPDGGGGAGGANGSAAAAVGASFGADATETVPCPFNAGAIIGARGATIREISEKTGARLVVKGNEAVTGGERVKGTEFVEIRGDPRAVAAAVAEVNRILEEKRADFVPSSSAANAPGNRRVPRRVRGGVRSGGVRCPLRTARCPPCTARSRRRRSGWFRRRDPRVARGDTIPSRELAPPPPLTRFRRRRFRPRHRRRRSREGTRGTCPARMRWGRLRRRPRRRRREKRKHT